MQQNYADVMQAYDPATNRTSRRMTAFEKVRLIGLRAEQLARGAKATVPYGAPEAFDPVRIARAELLSGTIPLMIRRRLTNGATEVWRVVDMVVPED